MAVIDTNQTRVLRALPDACKTLEQLAIELELSHRQVSAAAAALIRKGLSERIEAGCFRLTQAGIGAIDSGLEITSGPNAPHAGVRAPMRDCLRQRAWTAMRIHQSFTICDLLMAAARGDERDATNNLQRYCSVLVRAGVLRRMRRRVAGTQPASNGFAKWQLLKDLGPIAPSVRSRRGVLHDHNSGAEIAL